MKHPPDGQYMSCGTGQSNCRINRKAFVRKKLESSRAVLHEIRVVASAAEELTSQLLREMHVSSSDAQQYGHFARSLFLLVTVELFETAVPVIYLIMSTLLTAFGATRQYFLIFCDEEHAGAQGAVGLVYALLIELVVYGAFKQLCWP